MPERKDTFDMNPVRRNLFLEMVNMRSTKGPNFINNKSLRAHLLLGFSCNLGTSKNPRRQTWLPPLCAACCWHQSQSVEGYPGFVFLPMDGDLPDQSQLQVTYPGTQKEPDWEPGWELSVKDGLLFVWVEQSLSCYPRCVLPTPPPPSCSSNKCF